MTRALSTEPVSFAQRVRRRSPRPARSLMGAMKRRDALGSLAAGFGNRDVPLLLTAAVMSTTSLAMAGPWASLASSPRNRTGTHQPVPLIRRSQPDTMGNPSSGSIRGAGLHWLARGLLPTGATLNRGML